MKTLRKFFILFMVFLFTFAVVSCNKAENNEEKDPVTIKDEEVNFEQEFDGLSNYKDGRTTQKVEFNYASFNESAEKDNKEIARFAFLESWSSEVNSLSKLNYLKLSEGIEKFYNNIKATNIVISDGYNAVPNKDTIAYTAATKDLGDAKVVFINFRSSLKKDWEGNFDIGLSGNHQNYEKASLAALKFLKEYIAKIDEKNSIKLLISGYSKGGAISNLLGKLIDDEIDNKNITNLKKYNVFVYSFNAPSSVELSENSTKEYKNINLYYSSSDFVHYVIYGLNLGLVGNIHDVYYDNYITDYNNTFKSEINPFNEAEFDFTNFKIKPKKGGVTSLKEFYGIFLQRLFYKPTDENTFSVETRQKFITNLEPTLDYIFDLAFDDEQNYIAALKNIKIDDIDLSTIANRLMDYNNSIVYEKIKAAFDDANLNYDDAKLKSNCTILHKFAITLFMQNGFDFISDVATTIYNAKLIASNHVLEGFNLMLEHYLNNNQEQNN